jgi:hypothetical protein
MGETVSSVQILTVAANVLNNVFQTASKGWSFSLGVRRWPTTPNREKIDMLRNDLQGLGHRQLKVEICDL